MSGVFGFRGWQWLVLLEGLPSIVLGVMVYFFLANRPQDAKWLSDAEKQMVARDLQGDRRDKVQSQSSFSEVLRNPQVYALAGVYFSFYTILNALSIWP